jgi:hypothetical protein
VNKEPEEVTPAGVEELAAAMTALGAYSGANTPAEHAEEAARLGREDVYRALLVNALLGAVQGQAMLADGLRLDDDAQFAAWSQQYEAVGAGQDTSQLLAFVRWQVLRAATPIRQIAQRTETGPIPVAAAHAFNGLQLLLGAVAASQDAVATGDVDTLAAQVGQLREARASLENAIENTDILLDMLGSVGL